MALFHLHSFWVVLPVSHNTDKRELMAGISQVSSSLASWVRWRRWWGVRGRTMQSSWCYSIACEMDHLPITQGENGMTGLRPVPWRSASERRPVLHGKKILAGSSLSAVTRWKRGRLCWPLFRSQGLRRSSVPCPLTAPQATLGCAPGITAHGRGSPNRAALRAQRQASGDK